MWVLPKALLLRADVPSLSEQPLCSRLCQLCLYLSLAGLQGWGGGREDQMRRSVCAELVPLLPGPMLPALPSIPKPARLEEVDY